MSPLSAEDYQRLAREKLSPDVWDYIEGGSGAEVTLRANRQAFERARLRPRLMVDVSACASEVDLLGARLTAPVGVAPTAYHQLAHADGEVGTALGAGAAGVLYVVAMFASRTLEEIAAAATGPLWLQLYWLNRRDVLTDLVARAEANGFRALVLTADAPRIGRRLRDLRNGFAVDPDIRAVNVATEVMAATHRRRTGESALAVHAAQAFDPSLTWSDIAWLRERTELPIVLKGVLCGVDAVRAVESGVDAVIVSNHGGRQLDAVVASLDALAEVVDAVAGRCPVLLDGGVRGGTDVFTALALGASTVLLGRPVLWALAHDGATGVADLFTLIREELTHTMALAGRPSLTDLDRTAVLR